MELQIFITQKTIVLRGHFPCFSCIYITCQVLSEWRSKVGKTICVISHSLIFVFNINRLTHFTIGTWVSISGPYLWIDDRGCFYVQSPSHAYKRFRSIIRKLAVFFLFVKIQNILIRNVWKTQKFAISLSIKTFKILKVTRILG